ncbi:MAG: DUF2334 domain-containing protein [Gammaproteobacteria bacterium]
MSARYLVRLDDACAAMDARKWGLLESVFAEHGIKPIVAVVPDNRDPTLDFGPPDPAFWDKVRGWQAKGWTIGMHGHTHVMHATNEKLLVPFYKRSEFAGLPTEQQAVKIRAAWAIFQAQGVTPEVWIAPAHSFDLRTLQAVRSETPIRVVSDGIALDTYQEHGFHWIPQQLWRFAPRPAGLWTVNLHPNQMSEADIGAVGRTLGEAFRGRVIAFPDVRLKSRRKSMAGRLYHAYFWRQWRRAAAGAK